MEVQDNIIRKIIYAKRRDINYNNVSASESALATLTEGDEDEALVLVVRIGLPPGISYIENALPLSPENIRKLVNVYDGCITGG